MLVVSIQVREFETARRDAARAFAGGATGVELRIDGYGGDASAIAALIREHPDRTWIVTCRAKAEGGLSELDPQGRAERLLAATAGTPAYLDFEYAAYRESQVARERLLGAPRPPDGRPRLILSAHDFSGVPGDLHDRLTAMSAVPEAAAVKIAFTAHDIRDCFIALEFLRGAKKPTIAIAMGEAGLMTRVLAAKLGAFATFCTLDADAATAAGQVTLDEMINLYRFPSINADTRFFGVIGCPVAHSMSPALHNRWCAAAGVNAVYLPLLVGRDPGVFEGFLDGCLARPWLHAAGFSVTIPHKEAASRWVQLVLTTMGRRHTGAINTLNLPTGGDRAPWSRGGAEAERDSQTWFQPFRTRTQGLNTDAGAAIRSLAVALDRPLRKPIGLSADVLGIGGAGRTLVCALREAGCTVTVYGRDTMKTKALAREFGARAAPWESRQDRNGRILVNCTSLGMWPNVDESPMPTHAFFGCRLVFDLVYNPVKTRLLADAEAAGVPTLSGLDMFARQAALQFEAWTGIAPDLEIGRAIVLGQLGGRKTTAP